MKLQDMSPTVTKFKRNRTKKLGAWTFIDTVDDFSIHREVFHYGTLMGEFYKYDDEASSWQFAPLSTGWGSASDQQGMNKLISEFGWVFRRNGGQPRYEHSSGRRFPH